MTRVQTGTETSRQLGGMTPRGRGVVPMAIVQNVSKPVEEERMVEATQVDYLCNIEYFSMSRDWATSVRARR